VSHRKIIALAAVALLTLAGNAMATDVVYYTGDIWAGKTTDVGTITATMHYTADDNATLEIHYATDDGWKMTECHLWIAKKAPAARFAPGQYPYKSGTISTNSYSFSIPIADLKSRFGIDWGSDVYVMPHCALTWVGSGNPPGGETNPTGYGGCIVNPKKGSWFGFFTFGLTKPNEQPREPYAGLTQTCGYWHDFWSSTQVASSPWYGMDADQNLKNYLGDGTTVTGFTLAGETFNAADDLYNIGPYDVGDFTFFMENFVPFYCNTILNSTLGDAYYDDPDASGEFMENEQVSDIMEVAKGYREYQTPNATLYHMGCLLYQINYNTAFELECLYDGSQGRSMPLGQTARLTLSPNPFTGSARIRLQNSLQSEVRVSVYDLSGKKVNELTCNQIWNGTDARGRKLAAGVYLLRLVSGTQSVSARAVISR
jgi:hypothetical protein